MRTFTIIALVYVAAVLAALLGAEVRHRRATRAMSKYTRLEWVGGPLDGCVQHLVTFPVNIWTGPDVDGSGRLVIYKLMSSPNMHYAFDQNLTNVANQKLREQQE